MKLEIGMYVRTLNGKIWVIKSQQAISGHKRDIINASYNIIDLIEVGDYVNGYPVEEIYQPLNKELGKIIKFATDNASGREMEAEEIYEKDIKSIVTREQFESMKYEVE